MNLIRSTLLIFALALAGAARLTAQPARAEPVEPPPASPQPAPPAMPHPPRDRQPLIGTSGVDPTQPPAPVRPRVASTGGNSPHETISTVIGDRKTGNRVTITYGRPYTNNPKTGELRKIWGGLVKWDKADRLGADEATLLLTQQPLLIGETTIPAGAHTLYIVPSENGPTKLAISTNLGKWGVPVDETHDLARVDLKKDPLEKSVDQLTLAIENNPAGGGVLKIMWENTQFSLPFTVKK